MNIFSAIKHYQGGWSVSESRSFSQDEKAAIESNTVVESNYGLSVCFTMVGGGKTYIPLSTNSSANIGDSINMETAKLLTLSRQGDADIYRVEE